MRSQYGTRRRSYLPTVPRSSGGSYRPRSYGRPHDFRYEREPQLKAPKEVETHYLREERLPDVPRNPYRPEASRREVARVVPENIQDYADRHELLPENPTGAYKIEANASGTETQADIVISEFFSSPNEMKLEPTVESTEATLENPTDIKIDAALRAPELYESYELPVKDIELLLAELDASPLETKIEPDQKLEEADNAERPL